jgi:hypothetical protein
VPFFLFDLLLSHGVCDATDMYLACDQRSPAADTTTMTTEHAPMAHPSLDSSNVTGPTFAPVSSGGLVTATQSTEHHNMPMTMSDWKFLEALWKHNHANGHGQIEIDWRDVILSEADRRAEPAHRVLNYAINSIGRAVQVRIRT